MSHGLSRSTNLELRASLRTGKQRKADNRRYWTGLALSRSYRNKSNRALLPWTPARQKGPVMP